MNCTIPEKCEIPEEWKALAGKRTRRFAPVAAEQEDPSRKLGFGDC